MEVEAEDEDDGLEVEERVPSLMVEGMSDGVAGTDETTRKSTRGKGFTKFESDDRREGVPKTD